MSKINSTKAFGDCAGPLGFPMLSASASLVDAALKAIPQDVRDRIKCRVNGQSIDGYARRFVMPKGMDFNDAERSDVSIITSEAIDHDEEVVLAGGLDFRTVFEKNALVAWCHKYDIPPVGRSLWVARAQTDSGEARKAKTRYTPRPDDHPQDAEWFPSSVFHFVRIGDMPGKSIGFIPQSIRKPTVEEKSLRPELKSIDYLIDKALVIEYSVCPLPANPEALVESVAKMKAKGFNPGSELLDALGIVIPETSQPVATVESPIVIDTKTVPTMPACPKCETGDHMTQGDGDTYKCAGCQSAYKKDDEGEMVECMKSIIPEPKTEPVKPRSFVTKATIDAAVSRRKAALEAQAAKAIDDAVADRLAKLMGRV